MGNVSDRKQRRVYLLVVGGFIIVAACSLFLILNDRVSTGRNEQPLFKSFTDTGLKYVSDERLTEIVNVSRNNEDASILLKEYYYDKAGIVVAVEKIGRTIEEINYKYSFYDGETEINGLITRSEVKNGDSTFILIRLLPEIELPESFDLKLLIQEEKPMGTKDFEFNINLSRSEADKKTDVFNISKEYGEYGRVAYVDKIVFTPAATLLVLDYTDPLSEDYQIILENKEGTYTPIAQGGNSSIVNTSRTDKKIILFEPMLADNVQIKMVRTKNGDADKVNPLLAFNLNI